ncbi:LOW QUALITY PROTEIN: breast cancer anti-estrogen resistance protein 1 [Leucoraja erinacea]|uniref:LOW QUALITY PROTEIN: breast cancer anti-estrogen resistance protein 1 n=1 Tax=Leucoraja erinaceus TaxID=7782 RepID=UPI00245404C9|nr:LOW QUALITY PROTEIN: breast cancer anti-estrogen resistance protein 1 [Leucoraja erinacea]
MSVPNVLAKALYDNVAESPDELTFRKGDIMTVLERNTGGLDGWWLCSLHGRQGIVPGNRLKILVGMYDKKQPNSSQALQHPQSPQPYQQQNVYQMPSQSSQYTAMHPAYAPLGDDVYMMPSSNKAQQSVYQVPPNLQNQSNKYPVTPAKQQQQTMYQKSTSQGQLTQSINSSQEIYQVPPSMNQPQDIYQVPSMSPPQDIYQVPPSMGPAQDIYQIPPSMNPAQDIYQVPPSMNPTQDIYQVPPSLEKRNWEGTKPVGKVVLPTRVGGVYVYDTPPQMEQDEYDILPSRNLPPATQQEIYDVPPIRGGTESTGNQYGQEVYDFPPSVSKDIPDGPVSEDTYDVPPSFSHRTPKSPDSMRFVPQAPVAHDNYPVDDVYDIPPPAGKLADTSLNQDIYDVPPNQKLLVYQTSLQDIYDFPRDLGVPTSGGKVLSNEEPAGDYVYDVPPQVCRDAATEETTNSYKRHSASSTGSTKSNISTSSLDVIPVKESSNALPKPSSKELNLDLEVAMEILAKHQQSVESSISYLMSFIVTSWRGREHMEANVQNIKAGVEQVKNSVKDLLEFARGAVANSMQATDRTLYTKLSKQVQKMEDVYQLLLKHSQALDNCNWALNVLVINKQNSADDLDRFVMYSRGIPDDTKQLASFLHGNASLLFKRTKQQQQQQRGDVRSSVPLPGLESGSHSTNNNTINHYQTGSTDKANIQARPLPSPPRYTAEGCPDTQYDNNGSGWMEDYDYVHLQGKEEFEKTQKELLEKGNIVRQGKAQLEQQQVKQFERLEQEVTRPIENDLSNWTPSQQYGQLKSRLSPSDKQLLLFYSEQCELNVTTLINAIDAFFTSINANQPPKIFVAHSKFVILSAHKLVFIGDTLSRQAKSQEVRNKVTHYSNLLCEMLKYIVVTTKTAALQYPSGTAAKEMMDRVTELSHCTHQFKMMLGQLAAM